MAAQIIHQIMFATVRKVNELDVEDRIFISKQCSTLEVSIEASNTGSGNAYEIDGLQKRSLTGDHH